MKPLLASSLDAICSKNPKTCTMTVSILQIFLFTWINSILIHVRWVKKNDIKNTNRFRCGFIYKNISKELKKKKKTLKRITHFFWHNTLTIWIKKKKNTIIKYKRAHQIKILNHLTQIEGNKKKNQESRLVMDHH